MNELIKEENVLLVDEIIDWQQAVEFSINPLVEQGYCEKRYIDGIIDNTYKFGPYYVLTNDLALLHGKSEQGVLSTQFSIVRLNKPVYFLNSTKPVRILIGMCASSSEEHMQGIMAIANIFGDDDKTKKLLKASSSHDVYQLFISSVGTDGN
ncbi:MAG: PTS sugar transporter subunit IIA [Erysipelotrichaceae bacterium]